MLLNCHAVKSGDNAIFNLFVNRHRLELLKYLTLYSIFYELSTQFSVIWVSKQIRSFEELRALRSLNERSYKQHKESLAIQAGIVITILFCDSKTPYNS